MEMERRLLKYSFKRKSFVIVASCSALAYTVYSYWNLTDALRKESVYNVCPYKLALFRSIPLSGMTRIVGSIASITLPLWLRRPIYGSFSNIYGCNLSEFEPLETFPTINSFFTRPLLPGLRPIDQKSLLVSPVDGTVFSIGKLDFNFNEESQPNSLNNSTLLSNPQSESLNRKLDDPVVVITDPAKCESDQLLKRNDPKRLEKLFPSQLKGLRYPINRLLSLDSSNKEKDEEFLKAQNGNAFFYCSVYLAPGAYHRFHSPISNWKIDEIKRVPGECLPVAPWLMRRLPHLAAINERAVIRGQWPHGKFSMVPVGATNVRSIVLNCSPVDPTPLSAGDQVGLFEMGSLVVLVFEAPESFSWIHRPGDSVKLGEAMGNVL